jgi:hypothetical protein
MLTRLDDDEICRITPSVPSPLPGVVGGGRGNDRVIVGIGGASAAIRNVDGVLYSTDPWDFERDGPFQLKVQLYITQKSRTDVLLRFKQLDGEGTGASANSPEGVSAISLPASRGNELLDDWWNWLSLPWISAYGCYGVQVDTTEWSEMIIFQILPAAAQ